MKLIIYISLIINIPHSIGRNSNERVVPLSEVVNNDTKGITYEVGYQPDLTLEIMNILYSCKEKTCIMKCCPLGSLFTIQEYKRPECVPVSAYNTSDWEPTLEDKENIIIITRFPTLDISPRRPKNMTCESYAEGQFELGSDGTVYHFLRRERFSQEFYCVDKAFNNGTIEVTSRICHRSPNTEYYHNQNISKILVWIPITLSFLFLIIIFLLHFLLRNNFDLQKKCTLSSCLSLFLGFLDLILSRILAFHSEAGCTSVAIIGAYFFTSFYFWFHVMCLEISRIIRGTFKLKSITEMRQQSPNRLIYYNLYAWGVPLLVSCFTIAMQLIPLEDFPVSIQPYVIKPGINKGRCWFERGWPMFLYYVLLEIILYSVNAVVMFHAAYLLYKDQLMFVCCSKKSGLPELRSHASGNHVEIFKIQFLMFIVYLIMLITKAISQLVTGNQYLRIMIVILCLHATFLFLVIVQVSKNKEVVQLFEKISDRAKEIRSRIGFAAEAESSVAEVTRL